MIPMETKRYNRKPSHAMVERQPLTPLFWETYPAVFQRYSPFFRMAREIRDLIWYSALEAARTQYNDGRLRIDILCDPYTSDKNSLLQQGWLFSFKSTLIEGMYQFHRKAKIVGYSIGLIFFKPSLFRLISLQRISTIDLDTWPQAIKLRYEKKEHYSTLVPRAHSVSYSHAGIAPLQRLLQGWQYKVRDIRLRISFPIDPSFDSRFDLGSRENLGSTFARVVFSFGVERCRRTRTPRFVIADRMLEMELVRVGKNMIGVGDESNANWCMRTWLEEGNTCLWYIELQRTSKNAWRDMEYK